MEKAINTDWGYLDARTRAHLEHRLDAVCAIIWCLSHRRRPCRWRRPCR